MKKTLLSFRLPAQCAGVVLTTLLAVNAFAADCVKPAAPTLPDPSTAITPQMVKAKNDMKDYIAAAEAYLKCAESNTNKYNSMVDEMQKAAESFNDIVRQYKKRMSDG